MRESKVISFRKRKHNGQPFIQCVNVIEVHNGEAETITDLEIEATKNGSEIKITSGELATDWNINIGRMIQHLKLET